MLFIPASNPMKPALCALALEVWMDILVFPWISSYKKRLKLAQMCNYFGDWKFSEISDFFMHKFVKHTLDEMEIKKRAKQQNRISRFISRLPDKMAVMAKLRKKKIVKNYKLRKNYVNFPTDLQIVRNSRFLSFLSSLL